MSPPPAHLGPLSSRPAVTAAILLAIGILLHEQLPWAAAIAAVAVAAAVLFRSQRFVATALLALAVVAAGAALGRRDHFAFAADDIGTFATDDARLATVEARLVDEPQLTAGGDAGRPLPPRQTVLADVTRVLTTHGWVAATGQLPVRVNQPNPSLAAGDTVRLLGQLERPRPAANPGEFDWAVYYRRLRITATLTVTRAANATVIADPGFAPRTWARGVARRALAAGFSADHAADLIVLQAALLGDRDPQLREVSADFQQAGVAYQLSVSGLHIVLLAAGVLWACRRRRLQPRTTLAVVTGFVLLYAAVAAPTHSGVRSVLVSIVFAVGLLFRRSAIRDNVVAVAIIAMLVWHPLDLFTDGFQLSLAVVAAFLAVLPAVRRWGYDPDAVGRPRPELTVVGRALAAVGTTAKYAAVAWLATAPLTAAHFGRVTPWVVLVDLFVFPLVVVALYAGAIKVVATLLWPPLAHPLAVAAGWPVAAMRAVAHVGAMLPGASVSVPAPPMWAIVLYYGLLVAVAAVPAHGWRRTWRWAWRASPAVGLAGLMGLSLGSTPAAALPTDGPSLRVTLLSIGAGQCGLVELPDGRAVAIDVGSSTVPDVADRVVEPFLRSHGVRRLADVFLSHGDFDHISAAGQLAADFAPDAVFTSHHFRAHAVGNEPDLDLLAKLDALRLPPRELASGDRVDLGGGASVDVLWPPPGGVWSSNDAGLVLRLSYANRRVLFPADIQDPAFAGLLRHPEALAADVLVAPHHGSGEPLTPAFLAAVHPALIVSSNAARLSAKQRLFAEMAGPTPLLRTPQCGAITVTVAADGRVSVGTYLHPAAPR